MINAKAVTLDEVLNRNIKLPVCPHVFMRLTTDLKAPTVNNIELVEVLSSDPALTAKVLKAANSAFYGPTRNIRSVEQAIMRIGYDEVWSIAVAAKGKELFEGAGADAQFLAMLWDHSLKTGVFARALAKRLISQCQDDAYFTAGILHDFGKLLFAQLDKRYVASTQNGKIHGDDLTRLEQDMFGTDHATLGGELLKYWKLPDLIVQPVARHHDSDLKTSSPKAMARVIWSANQLAHDVEAQLSIPLELMERAGLSQQDVVFVATESLRQIAVIRTV